MSALSYPSKTQRGWSSTKVEAVVSPSSGGVLVRAGLYGSSAAVRRQGSAAEGADPPLQPRNRGSDGRWGQGQEAAGPWDLGSGASAPLPRPGLGSDKGFVKRGSKDTPCS